MKRNNVSRWTDRITDSLVAGGEINSSEAEAYRFGIEMLMLKAIHMISYMLIAAAMGKVPEFLIIFAVLCIFRRNTGGFHASTRLGCYFFSCASIGVSLLLCNAPIMPYLMHIMVPLLLLIMNGCAPVRNKNRRMDDDEAACFKRRLKRESVFFSLVYAVCVVLGGTYLAYLLFVGVLTNTLLMALGKVQCVKAA